MNPLKRIGMKTRVFLFLAVMMASVSIAGAQNHDKRMAQIRQAYADRLTLGPLPIGLIGGLPLLLLGAWVLLKGGKAEQGREAP